MIQSSGDSNGLSGAPIGQEVCDKLIVNDQATSEAGAHLPRQNQQRERESRLTSQTEPHFDNEGKVWFSMVQFFTDDVI